MIRIGSVKDVVCEAGPEWISDRPVEASWPTVPRPRGAVESALPSA